MVKFLTTLGIGSQIETIIRKARDKLILVTPYLQLSDNILERLKYADEHVNEIILIYGKKKLKDEELNKLKNLEKLEIYFHKDLHAKCYYNETMMVISSMNLHEFSMNQNREMGILITRDHDDDIEIYDEVNQEVNEILKSPKIKHISSKKKIKDKTKIAEKKDTEKILSKKDGFCIRCHDKIAFKPDKPYCYDCFSVWNEFKNMDYIDSYCHRCGRYNDSSLNKPLCYSCFSKKD